MGLGDYIFMPYEVLEEAKVNVKFFSIIGDDNIVTAVHTLSNNDCLDENGNHSEAVGISFLRKLLKIDETTKIVETWYYRQNRNHFGTIGTTYNNAKDIFIEPQPHSSYVLNSENQWEPKFAKPTDGRDYYWNINTESWIVKLPEATYTLGEDGIVLDEDGNPLEID